MTGAAPVFRLPLLLVGLGRVLARELDSELTAEGLSIRHLGTLGHLARDPGLSYSELARRAGVTVQSMHNTVRGLVERGAVRPGPDGVPGRAATLTVTAEGHRLLGRAGELMAAAEERLLAGVPETDRATVTRVLLGLMSARLPR